MAKNFWFKFDWDDWLNDEALSGCSLEAQGLWLRCICFMYRGEVSELVGTIEQLRRKLGVLPEELTRCLHELKTNGAADVRFGNGDVSIVSRRRKRDLKSKEANRLYVAKHRVKDECKTDVRVQSKSKSNNKSKEEEKEEEKRGGTPPLSLAPLTYPDSPFDHPAVTLYEEKFHVSIGSTFRKEIVARVTDLDVWHRLLGDNAARGDLPLPDRKKIANWILSAYDERVEKKANERKTEQRLPTPAEREAERLEHAKLPRADPDEFLQSLQKTRRTNPAVVR